MAFSFGSRVPGPGSRLLFASFLALTTVCAAAQSPDARPLLISGEVYAHGAQALLTPPSNSSPIVLRSFVAEGERVRSGDVVLRIDGGAAATSIRNFKSQQVQARARADKEIAELKVRAVDAERAWRNAETALAKAKADAGIPREHLSALDFDRYQGELTRAERDLVVKRGDWDAASSAASRRGEDAQLELGQLQKVAGVGNHGGELFEGVKLIHGKSLMGWTVDKQARKHFCEGDGNPQV